MTKIITPIKRVSLPRPRDFSFLKYCINMFCTSVTPFQFANKIDNTPFCKPTEVMKTSLDGYA